MTGLISILFCISVTPFSAPFPSFLSHLSVLFFLFSHSTRNISTLTISMKRKLESFQVILSKLNSQISILKSSLSSSQSDRLKAHCAVQVLRELVINEEIGSSIVEYEIVPALLKHMKAPEQVTEGDGVPEPHEYGVERSCVWLLSTLSKKPEYQNPIFNAGALPHLVDFLKIYKTCGNSRAVVDLMTVAAMAIGNLADRNHRIQERVRIDGGITSLVELLEFDDTRLQLFVVRTLRSVTCKDSENKVEVIKCKALPTLILMLESKDDAVQSEVVGLIEILISSPGGMREVLAAGALQPLIKLLRSSCSESQRGAASIICELCFDINLQVQIAQRGAIQPLIRMLESPNEQLQELSAQALARLATETQNKAGIAFNGGIEPLVNLLGSKNGDVQLWAASALCSLTDDEDNVADIIVVGGFQKLPGGDFILQDTKEHVRKIMKSLEEKMRGQVLKELLYHMRFGEKSVQKHVVLAIAHSDAPVDRKCIFVDCNGLELLIDSLESENHIQNHEASRALRSLAVRCMSIPPLKPPSISFKSKVYMGEQFVNNPAESNVTFLVEGKRFYAHRNGLVDSSDVFQAMLDRDYREGEATEIQIPDIKWDIFELVMRFIYSGTINIQLDVAQDLLRAADQYHLVGLKLLCEFALAQFSKLYSATSLTQACIKFLLAQFDLLSGKEWYRGIMHCIVPDIREFMTSLLTMPTQAHLI